MLIIFDCDGVLVDSELIALDILSAMMAEHGHSMSIAACSEAFMGRHAADIVLEMERRLGKPLAGEAPRMRARMLARLQREMKPVAGTRAALEALHVPVCVASSSDHARIKSTLEWAGLDRFFTNHLFSGMDVARGKPAPDLFLHAAKEMGVGPRDCVVIEDSTAGVQAAVAARMRVLGFTGGSHTDATHAARLEDAGADCIVATMADLPGAIASLPPN